jgi:hypothetical protein
MEWSQDLILDSWLSWHACLIVIWLSLRWFFYLHSTCRLRFLHMFSKIRQYSHGFDSSYLNTHGFVSNVSVRCTCGASQACTRRVRTFLRLQHTLSTHDETGACEMVDLGRDVVSTRSYMVRHVEMHLWLMCFVVHDVMALGWLFISHLNIHDLQMEH